MIGLLCIYSNYVEQVIFKQAMLYVFTILEIKLRILEISCNILKNSVNKNRIYLIIYKV